ncbi:MAG: ketopantoate reductase family protein [Microcoleus sp.]
MINILILGHGAVGLSLGGLLYASQNEKFRIYFLLRKNSKLEDYLPVSVYVDQSKILLPRNIFKSIDASPQADLLIVAVKAYDLEKSLKDVLHLLSERTLVLPILNGLENAAFIKRICPYLKVFEASIYISCEKKDINKIVNYSHRPRLIISSSEITNSYFSDSSMFNIDQLIKFLNSSSINCVSTHNSCKESWKKFVVTSSVNGACVFFDKQLGEVLDNRARSQFMINCLSEGTHVANINGISFSTDELNQLISMIHLMPLNSIPSMLHDYRNGKKTEIDFLNGKLVKLGKLSQIKTPTNEAVCNFVKDVDTF